MATISENTQVDFDNAEAAVIDMLQTARPGISLRRGSVLRELLVRPLAELYAADAKRLEDSMASRSLKLMKESGNAPVDEVNAILANFSTTLYEGKNASGYLFVQMTDDSVYSISQDTVFRTTDGLEFNVAQPYVITSADVSGDGYLELKQTEDGVYYFLLPVTAAEVGSEYEIEAGVRLTADPVFEGLVAATSYSKFTGGLDAQTIESALDELESHISVRGLNSRISIQSTLLDKNAGNFAGIVLANSVVGYGDPEQIRDKNNVFGVATGGKIDVFVRTSTTPAIVTVEKTGVWDNVNKVYVVNISHNEMPGYYAVKSVIDADSEPIQNTAGHNGMLSVDSYDVDELFTVIDHDRALHELLDTAGNPCGSAYTAYRDIILRVKRDNSDNSEPEHNFSVSVYAYPAVAAVQDYVDRDDVRNLKDDVLVRAAPLCIVSVSASVSVPPGHAEPDLFEMRKAVAKYINSRSFVPRLTASEIVAVLNKFDISRVEMMFGAGHGFKMRGRLRDAAGKMMYFPGPDIDIDAHANPKALVTGKTVCFATNVEDIEIKILDDRK